MRYLFLLIFISITISAQDDPFFIYVDHTGTDVVGSSLAYRIKEELRKSPAFTYTTADTLVKINLYLITMDASVNSNKNLMSVYSAVWTLKGPGANQYYTGSVGTCGSDVVDKVAVGIAADADLIADELHRYLNSLNK